MLHKWFPGFVGFMTLALAVAPVQAQVIKAHAPQQDEGSQGDVKPDGKGNFAKPRSGNGIFYHGGPLMLGTPTMYYIWYGNWSSNTAVSILSEFGQFLGGSPYYNINTTYYDGSNTHLSNSITFGPSATDSYSQGTALSDSGVQAVV